MSAEPSGTAQPITLTGTLLRFISCGVLSLLAGLAWRLTLAPSRVGIGSALLGVLFLLSGFVAGGLLWYAHDYRRRTRMPESVPDDQIVFSFVVFTLVPLAVLLVVGVIWVGALVARIG